MMDTKEMALIAQMLTNVQTWNLIQYLFIPTMSIAMVVILGIVTMGISIQMKQEQTASILTSAGILIWNCSGISQKIRIKNKAIISIILNFQTFKCLG